MAVFFPEKAVFLTHFMDLQDLRILRGPKMENRSPPGPQLCYLFQAGIPEIGLLGTFGPQNWPNRPGFDLLQRSKFALPWGNLSWDHRFWPP